MTNQNHNMKINEKCYMAISRTDLKKSNQYINHYLSASCMRLNNNYYTNGFTIRIFMG